MYLSLFAVKLTILKVYREDDVKIHSLSIYSQHAHPISIRLRSKRSTVSSRPRNTKKHPASQLMVLHFTKMHGLGNDFMVIDAVRQKITLTPQQIAALAQRGTGIGFDQCLLIEKSHQNDIDFFYRIFNADGQEVGQCGNGARCLARFVQYYGLSTKREIQVATHTTRMALHLNDDHTVTVNMGHPKLEPSHIPLRVQQQANFYHVPLANHESCTIHAVNVGNPHAVVLVSDTTTAAVQEHGQQISEHPLFPEQTNVGFMQMIKPNHIRLRVYERGCGETSACGSGAVAAVAIGRLYHGLSAEVTVSLPGGDLHVSWPTLAGPILLTGPATFVYEGSLLKESTGAG